MKIPIVVHDWFDGYARGYFVRRLAGPCIPSRQEWRYKAIGKTYNYTLLDAFPFKRGVARNIEVNSCGNLLREESQ